jgi:hypothetical protein
LSFCESNDTLPRAPFTVWWSCSTALLYMLFQRKSAKKPGGSTIWPSCQWLGCLLLYT